MPCRKLRIYLYMWIHSVKFCVLWKYSRTLITQIFGKSNQIGWQQLQKKEISLMFLYNSNSYYYSQILITCATSLDKSNFLGNTDPIYCRFSTCRVITLLCRQFSSWLAKFSLSTSIYLRYLSITSSYFIYYSNCFYFYHLTKISNYQKSFWILNIVFEFTVKANKSVSYICKYMYRHICNTFLLI